MLLPGIGADPAAREKACLANGRTEDGASHSDGGSGSAELISHDPITAHLPKASNQLSVNHGVIPHSKGMRFKAHLIVGFAQIAGKSAFLNVLPAPSLEEKINET